MTVYAFDRYILQLNYSVDLTPGGIVEHKHKMYINPLGLTVVGTPFDDIGVRLADGSDADLVGVVDDYGDLIEPIYGDSASFGSWQVYKIAAETSIAVLYSQLDIGHVGSNVNPNVAGWQSTLTFHTTDGLWAKAQFMESAYGTKTSIIPPYPAEAAAIADYITGAASPFLGLHGGIVWANMHFSNGENEKITRLRYRS